VGSPAEKSGVRRLVWRQRGRRCLTGVQVLFSTGLAALLVVMLNFLAFKYANLHWDVSSRKVYSLSAKTVRMLADLEGRARIVAFIEQGDTLYDEIRFLLKEYDRAASRVAAFDLQVDVIDPDRDLALADELARAFDVDKPGVVVFEAGERRKYIETDSIVDYERSVDYEALMKGEPSVTRRRTGFRGEQVFSSALLSVAELETPVVYFLAGHGEHAVDDYTEQAGYSGIARIMRRDNMDIRPLLMAEHGGVPEDCAAVVVAGPDRRLSRAEVDAFSDYLEKNGRLLVLSDAGTETGIEDLLRAWDVRLGADVVAGLTLTGRELFVNDYGEHPITARFKGVTTMFYRPRSVEPASGGSEVSAADKPKARVLARSSDRGWSDADIEQMPPRFDPGPDRAGPIGVAVAVEKGSISGIDVELRPTRLVVVGDADFVSNGALRRGVGGNVDFFMGAVNWLLERESLLGISPKAPGVLQLDMDSRQLRLALLSMLFGVPALVTVVGLCAWNSRRR